MAFREVAVTEIREVLRAWLSGAGLRRVAEQAGVDRKTARRYAQAPVDAGQARDGGLGQLTDELVGLVAQVVRPVRPGGHGQAWEALEARRAAIEAQVGRAAGRGDARLLPDRRRTQTQPRHLRRPALSGSVMTAPGPFETQVIDRTDRRTCSLAPRAGDPAQVGPSAGWWTLEDGPGWRRSGRSIGPPRREFGEEG
jgi:hypothetical protein